DRRMHGSATGPEAVPIARAFKRHAACVAAGMERAAAFCRNRDGRRIAYMTWGAGPWLVVPPGWVSHLELQWQDLGMEAFYARLAESFRLVFYDRRGSGLSERVRDDFTLDAERGDLE